MSGFVGEEPLGDTSQHREGGLIIEGTAVTVPQKRGRGRPTGVKDSKPRQVTHRKSSNMSMGELFLARRLGDLPHEFLLRVMRGGKISTRDHLGRRVFVLPTLEQRIDCAKAAAPYFAPRLSSVEVIKSMGDGELEQIVFGAIAEMGSGNEDLLRQLAVTLTAAAPECDIAGIFAAAKEAASRAEGAGGVHQQPPAGGSPAGDPNGQLADTGRDESVS